MENGETVNGKRQQKWITEKKTTALEWNGMVFGYQTN